PTNLAAEAMELQELVREAPRKLSDALSLVAANRLQVRLAGLDDSRLMDNLQKIANRIASAVVIAALLLSSTQLMRLVAGPTPLGYPALAVVMFLVAAVLGLMLVASAVSHDRLARPVERTGTEEPPRPSQAPSPLGAASAASTHRGWRHPRTCTQATSAPPITLRHLGARAGLTLKPCCAAGSTSLDWHRTHGAGTRPSRRQMELPVCPHPNAAAPVAARQARRIAVRG